MTKTTIEELFLKVKIILEKLSKNPHCEHGPTVLFEGCRFDGTTVRYFACSTCRDRKLCRFYLEESKNSRIFSRNLCSIKQGESFKHHTILYKKYCEYAEKKAIRGFCNTCAKIVTKGNKHSSKCSVNAISKGEEIVPSKILNPLLNPKFEAQYFFTEKSWEIIKNLLKELNIKKVLSVGAPRIHESFKNDSIQSILMDIDDRFANFYSVEEYIPYNYFNHFFFSGSKSRDFYRKFLEVSEPEDLLVFIDPPFGGRMELIANTLNLIERDWRKVNNFSQDKFLPIVLAYPYFQEKAVSSSMPSLKMLEYLVDYENHPLYTTGPKGMPRGSPVRLFTNLSLDRFALPEADGYTFCSPCKRWVHPRNVHCDKCNNCTSKDGSTYVHCDLCGYCVKPKWVHCSSCSKCYPRTHECQKEETSSQNQTELGTSSSAGNKDGDFQNSVENWDDDFQTSYKEQGEAFQSSNEERDDSQSSYEKRDDNIQSSYEKRDRDFKNSFRKRDGDFKSSYRKRPGDFHPRTGKKHKLDVPRSLREEKERDLSILENMFKKE